jgi:hypothetical protein
VGNGRSTRVAKGVETVEFVNRNFPAALHNRMRVAAAGRVGGYRTMEEIANWAIARGLDELERRAKAKPRKR